MWTIIKFYVFFGLFCGLEYDGLCILVKDIAFSKVLLVDLHQLMEGGKTVLMWRSVLDCDRIVTTLPIVTIGPDFTLHWVKIHQAILVSSCFSFSENAILE